LQDLDFHDQLADAPVGLVELRGHRVARALLETRVDPGERPITLLFKLEYRHRDLPRDSINWLASQKTQNHPLLPTRRPALHFSARAGLACSRATGPCQ